MILITRIKTITPIPVEKEKSVVEAMTYEKDVLIATVRKQVEEVMGMRNVLVDIELVDHNDILAASSFTTFKSLI